MIDVSVVLVTYNSKWEKVRITLLSILRQKNVSLQIVIADDGSEKTYAKEIDKLMADYNFGEYLILNATKNRGTVLNISYAMTFVKGRYTKTIAPGDCFFDENVLWRWLNFMQNNHLEVTFGNAVFYSKTQDLKLYKTKGSPVNSYLYRLGSKRPRQFVDYLLANDTILGAAQLMKTDTLTKYIEIIKNKIVYAEDYMIRIMIYDGVGVIYYPENVIWYEYGTGISTSKNNKWEVILRADFETSNDLISRRNEIDFMQKKFKLYLALRKNKLLKKLSKVLIFPSTVMYRIKIRFAKSSISLNTNIATEIEKKFCWIDI